MRDDFLRRDIDSSAIVWAADQPVPWALDPVSTVMIDVVDGEATVADLVEDVCEVIGVPRDTAIGQVSRVLQTFEAAGLLTPALRVENAQEAVLNRDLFANPPSN